MRILRRSLRDGQNPFLITTEEHFIQLYRLPKYLVMDLIEELKPFLNSNQSRSALPCHVKVLSAIRFFATGSFQRAVGQDSLSSLSQTSVSRSITEISIALNRIAHSYVQFPTRDEFPAIKAKFYEKFGFPGVIGLVDWTHIKVAAPRREIEHVFYCRKGGHSMNVQIVCGADFVYVWRRSKVKTTLERLYNEGERNFWLLGDSGYALQPWLMTPLLAADSEAENRYNASRKQTRGLVELCIGILKSRFRCLAKERAKAGVIINACVVLHNVLIKARVPFLDHLELENDNELDFNGEEDSHPNSNRILQEGVLEPE